MGGRLARHKTEVVNGSKFSVSAWALIQRGFEEVIGAAGLAMGPKVCTLIAQHSTLELKVMLGLIHQTCNFVCPSAVQTSHYNLMY